jgi:hypothetical protein
MAGPKWRPSELDVTVSGEITRFSHSNLIEAYTRLVPPTQRNCRPTGSDAAAPGRLPVGRNRAPHRARR